MRFVKEIQSGFSVIKRYHYRSVLIIALLWTIIDTVYWVRYMHLPYDAKNDSTFTILTDGAIVLRAGIVFFMSWIMGYLLIFDLRQRLRNYPLIINIFLKTGILLLAAIFMNFLLHITYSVFIRHLSLLTGLNKFYHDSRSTLWVLEHSVGWLFLFVLTQILIELNEKYSPGVFWDILLGRYIQPRVEKRIVMFLDLTDSTPIAEQLSSKQYFRFIRDFVYYVSVAIMEYHGRIYQYVGDEIVVYWKYSPRNLHRCIQALVTAKRLLQRHHKQFQRRYGVVPEFKVGIHVGEVTVGEIGIIKKDIAMSGDTMNTAARIRNSCNELQHKVIASKEFIDGMNLAIKRQELGEVDLKGKSNSMELYAILV